MPQQLEDCVAKLIAKGYTRSRAYAICTASLQRAGMLKKGTNKLVGKVKKRKKK